MHGGEEVGRRVEAESGEMPEMPEMPETPID
jgi:hypothetical protein